MLNNNIICLTPQKQHPSPISPLPPLTSPSSPLLSPHYTFQMDLAAVHKCLAIFVDLILSKINSRLFWESAGLKHIIFSNIKSPP